MLTEYSSHLSQNKFNELLSRLESEDTKTALAAEAELSVVWAISRVAHVVSEPVLPHSSRRPEAGSDNLFRSGPAVIEVRAVSDDHFSGKTAMNRTANIIANYADSLRKKAGAHLYFEFSERNYWTTKFHRERCVDSKFELTPEMKVQLRKWICAPEWPNSDSIRISHGKTDVVISWKTSPGKLFRTFSSMPPVAYDLKDNPVYKALDGKSDQVSGAAAGTLRCVVLVDAGCELLRSPRPRAGAVHELSGEAIIHHALANLNVDVVLVLSPRRQRGGVLSYGHSKLVWSVTTFDRRGHVPVEEYVRIEQMAAQLPTPRHEGYQARALHEQGLFARDRTFDYLPTKTTMLGGNMTIRLSAGLLHEYLAGRIDAEGFRRRAFGTEMNYFDVQLGRGSSIRMTGFETGGIDEDDDYVVFDLNADPDKIAKKTEK
jgi:hypothetical protein